MIETESKNKPPTRRWIAGGVVCLLLVGMLIFRHPIVDGLETGFKWVSDREKIAGFIHAYGNGAPLVFMAIQLLQVVLAPIPGEATGFIGGYLFGTVNGFIYSSLALAIGSMINFAIGRYLGKRFVRRWIPDEKWQRMDRLLKRQGIIVVAILFVFPGFPKDYLCLFLGISDLPLKVFLPIATVGRMPGTLMLSLQGGFLFEKNYTVFAVVLGITALFAFLAIRYRDRIYGWIEKPTEKPKGHR